MAKIKLQVTKNIRSLDRVDLYEENEVSRIVEAQKARAPQSFPSADFDKSSGQTIYVYAFTTPYKLTEEKLGNIVGLENTKILGSAEFYDDYTGKNPFARYKPNLEGSIRLSFNKKSS